MYKNFNVYMEKKSRPILHFYSSYGTRIGSSKMFSLQKYTIPWKYYRSCHTGSTRKSGITLGSGEKRILFFLQTSFNVVHESMNPGVQINTHYHNKISYGIVSTYQHNTTCINHSTL